ncbi:MAG: SIMPL domain-containing protein [Candidatus Margulisbacteria bacterium]|jgi:uncharacterized protein YggE|nr:SIMPL domain-containing protein [Candidatus Margulisiibacteriota bacterium]
MKKIIILICLVCLAAVLLAAENSERRALITYGEGLSEAAPDTVVINLGVQREGLTAEDAQGALRKALGNVLEALKPLDIPDDSVKTDGYSLYPVYKQRKDASGGNYETEEIDRYRTYIRLSIEIHQIPQVGKIADTAIKAGVNRVENISFTLKDKAAAKKAAIEAAVANAQDKAKLLAEKFNIKLLTPFSIVEENISYGQQLYRNTSMIMADAKSAGFNLPEGKIQVTSRVNVSYEIEPFAAAATLPIQVSTNTQELIESAPAFAY